MKKIIFVISILTLFCFNTNAQTGQGHVDIVVNNTNCDVTILPFCYSNPWGQVPCNYQWTIWNNGSNFLTLGPTTAWLVGNIGLYAQGCDPMHDVTFYQICWSTPNCDYANSVNCTYTMHPGAANALASSAYCNGALALNLQARDQYLPPCEDCCPNGAKIYWVGDDIHIDCIP